MSLTRGAKPRKQDTPNEDASSKGAWQKLFPRSSSDNDAPVASTSGTSSIKAFLRLRPAPAPTTPSGWQGPPASQHANVEILNDQQVVCAYQTLSADASSAHLPSLPTSSSLYFRQRERNEAEVFSFTQVLEDTTQESLYDATARSLVGNLLGANSSGTLTSSLLLSYGVSGGGKTYTIQGTEAEPGLLPRALTVILSSIEETQSQAYIRPARLTGFEIVPPSERARPPPKPRSTRKDLADNVYKLPNTHEYSVWATFVEVYNENVLDLLGSDKRKNLTLKQDSKASDHKYIHGVERVRLWSAEHARDVINKGLIARQISATRLNETSSRSHSVFTIQILRHARGADPASGNVPVEMSRMSIVDLAGSERPRNTQSNGDRLKEAGKINRSLMVLGQCFDTIRANAALSSHRKPAIVPFRHSKLTEILKPYFVGNGEVILVGAMDPYRASIDENQNVLRFCSLARHIKTNYAEAQVPTMREIMPRLSQDRVSKRSISLSNASASDRDEAESGVYDSDNDVDDDALVDTLFDEIRFLRREGVQREIEFEAKVQAVRQEERKRTEAKLDGLRAQLEDDLVEQRAMMEEYTNKKVENLQQTYGKVIEALRNQLDAVTSQLDQADEVGNSSSDTGSSSFSGVIVKA